MSQTLQKHGAVVSLRWLCMQYTSRSLHKKVLSNQITLKAREGMPMSNFGSLC